MAIFYLFFAAISLATGQAEIGSGIVSLVIGFVLFGVIGAILGILFAFCYNFAAKRWGGLHLDFHLLEQKEEPKKDSVAEDSKKE